MSDDDELRSRLQGIPGPRAGLDADAVIARAKRRRRPKTIALSSAATIAGVLIVGPLVVPGLTAFEPASMSGVSSESGAAPESYPDSAPESDGDGAESPAATEEGGPVEQTDAGEGDQGASGEGGEGAPGGTNACTPMPAGNAGLALRFLDDPSDGTADLGITNLTDAQLEVRLDDVGSVEVTAEGQVVSAGFWPGRWGRSIVAPTQEGIVTVDLEPRQACAVGAGEPVAIAPVATVLVVRNGEEDATELVIVGDPWR
ncbi:hypothetical protein [Agrococcus sp. ARC_14]|uniref:hypothetical protein n=1 Tax=Agrococcus sp. ARC_14 TaxID=2919927 RepID=UPI001F05D088|nr:hypothetical protein [Agrococcus sp. ARC_14]MCH1883743.1 hypothetical protein [Agrococcus sp. ARC_14]